MEVVCFVFFSFTWLLLLLLVLLVLLVFAGMVVSSLSERLDVFESSSDRFLFGFVVYVEGDNRDVEDEEEEGEEEDISMNEPCWCGCYFGVLLCLPVVVS